MPITSRLRPYSRLRVGPSRGPPEPEPEPEQAAMSRRRWHPGHRLLSRV